MPEDPTLAADTVHQSDSTPFSHLYTVALKLPVFWSDSCESWFINAESQFHLKNITSSITKFHHVVASLPQKEIDNVVDIIRNPPAADPYGVLRSRLLQTHSLTDYACCESIMSLPLSGDMLPSALLSRMRALLPIEHQECLFLWYAFLRQLPSDVRSHLVHDKTANIAVLSLRADEIYWSSLSSSSSVIAVDSVHAVNTPPSRQNRPIQHSHRASPNNKNEEFPHRFSNHGDLWNFRGISRESFSVTDSWEILEKFPRIGPRRLEIFVGSQF